MNNKPPPQPLITEYPRPEELSEREKAFYLVGFFEGDGWVTFDNMGFPRIGLQTTSRKNIQLCRMFLEDLGIVGLSVHHAPKKPKEHQDQWVVVISERDRYMNWCKKIGAISTDRREKLERGIRFYETPERVERRERTFLIKKRLRADYAAGISRAELAEKYGCSESTINYHINQFKFTADRELMEERKQNVYKRRFGTEERVRQDNELKEDYQNGLTYEQMTDKHGIPMGSVKNRLEWFGVELNRGQGAKAGLKARLNSNLENDFMAGLTHQELAIKYECGKSTIGKYIEDMKLRENQELVQKREAAMRERGNWRGR